MFTLFELLMILGLLYIAANLVRYICFKTTKGGGLFGLSDQWIKNEEEKGKKDV